MSTAAALAFAALPALATVEAPPAVAAATGSSAAVASVAAPAATPATPVLGAYLGPGRKNLARAAAFGRRVGSVPTQLLDFPPDATWRDITGPAWLLEPYRGSGKRLEYSVPMFPASGGSLDACWHGRYNAQWLRLARNLTRYGQSRTIVRPGWEFNGSWYRWSAKGRPAAYAGCFRQIVRSMRSVPGQRFRFDWNPNINRIDFPAEQAYPGDAYVDYVGLDIYDLSWSHYPVRYPESRAVATEQAWRWLHAGDHGLQFWAAFVRAHRKRLALTEWGLAYRSDGHGGGDNPAFVAHVLDFVRDRRNWVAYATYFNSYAPDLDHDITRAGTRFPTAALRLRSRSRGAWASSSTGSS